MEGENLEETKEVKSEEVVEQPTMSAPVSEPTQAATKTCCSGSKKSCFGWVVGGIIIIVVVIILLII